MFLSEKLRDLAFSPEKIEQLNQEIAGRQASPTPADGLIAALRVQNKLLERQKRLLDDLLTLEAIAEISTR